MKNTPVKVIFKRFPEGDIIALFPTLPGDNDPRATCLSYQHVGQHGAASMSLFTLPAATPAEYRPLAQELRRIGYRLHITDRPTRADLKARMKG